MKDEQKLIAAILDGKTEAFEPLIRPYRQALLTLAYRMTGDMEQAKEICQEAVMKAYKYLGSYKPGGRFKNWLYKLTVNTAYDLLRKERRQRQLYEMQSQVYQNRGPDPEQTLLHREIGEKIKSFLKILTPKEKAVFLLRDGEGLSIREASQALGCSSISVRTHLSRARSKLRVEFGKVYGTEERR